MKETDLYPYIKTVFEDLGYTVQGEVDHMDVVAIKEDEFIIIEMKTSFNLKLLTQAALRQKMSESVYVAIPAPKSGRRFRKDFMDLQYLLRRLELGLILVYLDGKNPRAEICFDPKPFDLQLSMKRNKQKKARALKEIAERKGDYNLGGTRGKLVTAYREKALITLKLLGDQGPMTVKALREATGNPKMQPLLYANYYGWFERVKNGTYQLSEIGQKALTEYAHILENQQILNEIKQPPN